MSQIGVDVLITRALDQLADMDRLEFLLDVCLEQVRTPETKAEFRIELLLDCYQAQYSYHREELKIHLKEIQKLIVQTVNQ